MPPVKEPTFFCQPFQSVASPIRYFELFGKAGGAKAIGEASHAYLSHPSTPKVLRLIVPDAKFIVILRNPADRAHSLYHHMRREGWEWIGSFERALRAEENRVRSPHFEKNCPQYYYNFLYFRSGLYGEQIERYYSHFDRGQFHFLTLDQLRNDSNATLQAVLKFLQIDTGFSPPVDVHNKSDITARWARLQYAWRSWNRCPNAIRKWGDFVLHRINRVGIPPLGDQTKRELMQRYRSDLAKLNALTGIQFDEIAPVRD